MKNYFIIYVIYHLYSIYIWQIVIITFFYIIKIHHVIILIISDNICLNILEINNNFIINNIK